MPVKKFSNIYIVNLPERADRRAEMEAELIKAGITQNDISIKFYPAIKPIKKLGFPSIGARGCFLSHLAILKKVQSEGGGNVLIMEDDLAISIDINKIQNSLEAELNKDHWGIIYFGHVEKLDKSEQYELISFDLPILTTHFYAINSKYLDRLIDFLEVVLSRSAGHPNGGPMHYDGALSTFRMQNPDIQTLIASPNLGWQRSSKSDIAEGNWFDTVPLIKTLVPIARKLKNYLR